MYLVLREEFFPLVLRVEFFLLVLKRLCEELKLPVAIGSKTVGRSTGVAETPAQLCRVMERWRKVWQGGVVRSKEELLLPVAVDDPVAVARLAFWVGHRVSGVGKFCPSAP